MRRVGRHLLTGILVAGAAFSGCGNSGAIRSVDDASRYFDDVLRGSPDRPPVAPDADPIAAAAVEDTADVKALDSVIERTPSKACEVVSLVNVYGEASPTSTEPVLIRNEGGLYSEASRQAIPASDVQEVLETARQMAQSSWVEASDKACTAAQQF